MSITSEALYSKLNAINAPMAVDSFSKAKIDIAKKGACNALISAENAEISANKCSQITDPIKFDIAKKAAEIAKQYATSAELQAIATITSKSAASVTSNSLTVKPYADGAEQQNAIAQTAWLACKGLVTPQTITDLINNSKTIDDIKTILLKLVNKLNII